ncbi:DNA primase [Flagellatimonas centrodinii]|uniref:DNA primase n=1 Tax=Flagellatimonas centrodinii TaxID=2806210 RepID=UPI001FEF2F5D|nr:DNA primase [Flagellatimonas centrodinii]ULQ48101.1 DNA primase [Flagellatimonas centrodinii]
MAGRIPDAFIQDLLARTDIVEVIGARVELKRAGKELKGLSPFTHEKSPSFFVSPVKQMFFDFSAGKSGTVITFLMEYDRLSFVEAVEELALRAGVEVPREGGPSTHVVMDGPLDALAGAQRFFREQLRLNPTAIEYLQRRGVSGDTGKTFGIGYAPDRWDALCDFLKTPEHAVTAGLLIERDKGGVYDRFRNRVMFPIRDTRGRVIAFGGRTLGDDPAKYLNSPETPLFHKGRNLFGLYEAKTATRAALPYLIVVEGYMDVVMLHQFGITEAVATLGTATTRDHLTLLYKATSKVVFCFDGDRAGRSAAWRALEQALPEVHDTRECVFMFLPDGHDPDSLVQEEGADAFRARIDRAPTLTEFLISELSKQVQLGSLDGRAKLAALARPYLGKMREGPLRTLLVDELARITRLSADDVLRMAAPEAPARNAEASAPTATRSSPSAATRAVKAAIQALLEQPALAQRVEQMSLLVQSPAPGIRVLIDALDYFHAHPDAHTAHLVEAWRGTPAGAALQRLMAEPPILSAEDRVREFDDTIQHLAQGGQARRRDDLMEASRERELSAAEIRELGALLKERRPAR